ncbi:MAG: hypothetical protein J6K64_04285 [Clostridia bacterium]|nr:hypothetical protein [Clostridia bacterium]
MKKILSVLLCLCLMFCSCLTVNANSVVKENNPTILSESAVSKLKEDYDLTSEVGKKEYLRKVFNNIGVDEKYVNLLKGDLLDDFVNSEKYGCKVTEPENKGGVSLLNSGSTDDYDNGMHLVIVWSKTGDEYAIMGACEWYSLPVMRWNDIISIDLGAGSIVNGSQALVIQYEHEDVLYEESYSYLNSEYIGEATKCVFQFDVPELMDSLVVAIGYNIKNESIYNTIYLQYFHNLFPWDLSIGISIEVVGISVTPGINNVPYGLQCGTA